MSRSWNGIGNGTVDKVPNLDGSLLERETHVATLCAEARKRISRLGPDETRILEGLVDGKSNRSLAEALRLDLPVVELRRRGLLAQLEAVSTADAVRIGLYAGLGG